MATGVPRYKELPEAVPGYRCSWTYFNSLQEDKQQKDALGTLNFLTQERRAAAAKGILTGKTVSVDLPVSCFSDVSTAFGGRPAPKHELLPVGSFCYEDKIDMNTQVSTQWDGFRHFAVRSNVQFYNGWTAADIEQSDVLGVDAWVRAGGIVGRGVLLDFYAYLAAQGKEVGVNSGHRITLEDIKGILAAQKTEVQPGDILIIRSGWLKWYLDCTKQERFTKLCEESKPGAHSFVGLSQDEELVEWLWDNQVAAVAGDQVALECTPPPADGFGWLHEHLLAGLGCPMGELFDTEQLAEECVKHKRFTFFFSSMPLHVKGGVATPANGVAIF